MQHQQESITKNYDYAGWESRMLGQLEDKGFNNRRSNTRLLRKYGHNVAEVERHLSRRQQVRNARRAARLSRCPHECQRHAHQVPVATDANKTHSEVGPVRVVAPQPTPSSHSEEFVFWGW